MSQGSYRAVRAIRYNYISRSIISEPRLAPVGAAAPAPRSAFNMKTNATQRLHDKADTTLTQEMKPQRVRQAAISKFRSAVRIVDGVKYLKPDEWIATNSCGILNILEDDMIVNIIDFLLAIPRESVGLSYIAKSEQSRVDILNFALTCKRMSSVFNSLATLQRAEMLARGSTKIMPRNPSSVFPFTEQMRSELLSCDQLVMLRSALKSMACHCANNCCARYQKCFNKEVQKGGVFSLPSSPRTTPSAAHNFKLLPVFESSNILAPSLDGNVTFAYISRKGNKSLTGGTRCNRRIDSIVQACKTKNIRQGVNFQVSHSVDMEFDGMSSPLTMRTSHDGSAVLFICALHDTDPNNGEAAQSALFYWNTKQDPQRIYLSGRCSSPQDAWFVQPDDREECHRFVVAGSTGFLHSSGHTLSTHEATIKESSYAFETFCVASGVIDHEESTSDFDGKFLISCSPTERGNRVLALSKTHDAMHGVHRFTNIHRLELDSESVVPHNISNTTKGPLCACMSHSGDCVVSLHKTKNSIIMDVLVLNSGEDIYIPVQKIDLSAWLALSPKLGDSPMTTDLVKATYDLVFSPCGRFVAVVDRRPLFGEPPNNHGVVTIDMAMRMETRGLRPHPMFATDEQAPRSFHWTRSGIWLQPPGTDSNGSIGPRGGAICVYAPTTVSFW